MKTLEDTKMGLECCKDFQTCTEYGDPKCPYHNVRLCVSELQADALRHVQQLEQERDAAVAALAVVRSCETCKHAVMPGSLREYVCMADDYDCATCEASDCACKTCEDGSGWVFGGVKRDG